jgi:hypothetical protein
LNLLLRGFAAIIFIQTQTARKKENKHMRTYRNKPQFVGGDFSPALSGKAFYDAGKAIGVSPWLGQGAFYLSLEAKKIAKTSNRKSDAYKKAYANLSAKLQYLKKKGLVMNVRYGVWQYVTHS